MKMYQYILNELKDWHQKRLNRVQGLLLHSLGNHFLYSSFA
jgi:hypothetical protein